MTHSNSRNLWAFVLNERFPSTGKIEQNILDTLVSGIFRSTLLSIVTKDISFDFIVHCYKDRMDYSGYSSIRDNSFDIWVSGHYE